MPLLRLENVTLRFGGLTAVSNLSFSVEQGKIVSLIGPNGAGKTSAFNAITGIYPPTEGRVVFMGAEPRRYFGLRTLLGLLLIALVAGVGLMSLANVETLWDATINNNYVYQEPFPWRKAGADLFLTIAELPLSDSLLPFFAGCLLAGAGGLSVWLRSRRSPDVVACYGIARTFQNIRLFQNMSVLENVLVGMHSKAKTGSWQAALQLPGYRREQRRMALRGTELLRFVGLDEHARLCASALSYGDQRRLEIARALASEPKLLLLDEPAAGMNPAESSALMELIKEIQARGITVLLIEHHMKVVMGISDWIVVLDYGNKIAEGPPEEIRQNPKVIEAYLGTEEHAA